MFVHDQHAPGRPIKNRWQQATMGRFASFEYPFTGSQDNSLETVTAQQLAPFNKFGIN